MTQAFHRTISLGVMGLISLRMKSEDTIIDRDDSIKIL